MNYYVEYPNIITNEVTDKVITEEEAQRYLDLQDKNFNWVYWNKTNLKRSNEKITPEELLKSAILDIMRIKITKIDVSKGSIQYWYVQNTHNYFIRITKDRLVVGFIAADGKSYAHGLPNDVILYLINNFNRVVL